MTSCPQPPTHLPTVGPITQAQDAADYLERHNIAGLLNGMMAGLMIALPDDHVEFMRRAVNSAREMGLENVDWQTFVWPLHPYNDPLRRKLLKPPVPVDGGNLPVGVIERRDFTLSLTDHETMHRPRLPFWHIDYFTQRELDDPEFFLVPDWPVPEQLDPPVDELGPPERPDEVAAILKPGQLCPSPPPEKAEDKEESGTSLVQSSQSQESKQGTDRDEDTQSQTNSKEQDTDAGNAEDASASHSTMQSPTGFSDVLK